MRHDHFDKDGNLRCRVCGKYKSPDCFHYSKLEKYRDFKSPECKECSKLRHKKHRKNKPKTSDLEKHLGLLLNGCRSRINNGKGHYKQLSMDIDKKFLLDLYNKQGGKCAISGLTMTYIVGDGKHATNMSIDRIDSSKGYTKDNVQLVCSHINMMKSDLSMEELYMFCEAVIENR